MRAVSVHDSTSPRGTTPENRVAALDWDRLATDLDSQGFALLQCFLDAAECAEIISLYDRSAMFRKRVVMERHAYGRGEYQYFAYPLPDLVAGLRAALYPRLSPIANRWNEAMGFDIRFPEDHEHFLKRCHEAGQIKPTPLILRYGAGDYNRLHQDLYGEHVFPLQATVLLSKPGDDFTGGEFVLTEQRPRIQSRAEVVPLERGDAVIFPVRHRPMRGPRGFHRAALRHGVSTVRSGSRHTLGIIFHDAA